MTRTSRSLLTQFYRSRAANVLVPWSVAMVVVIALAGNAMDFASVSGQRQKLQTAADHAALAAAQQMALAGENTTEIEAVAKALVGSRMSNGDLKVSAVADMETRQVTVTVSQAPKSYFPTPFSRSEAVKVSATAELQGTAGNICMIALDPNANKSLEMTKNARLTAENCIVQGESTHRNAVSVSSKASVSADLICAVGGFHGKENQIDGQVLTGCQSIGDPLAARAEPFQNSLLPRVERITSSLSLDENLLSMGCDHNSKTVGAGDLEVLTPGVYCGGLSVDGGTALLQPGNYVMLDGALRVDNGGTLKGDYVGFFMTGLLAAVEFEQDSHINLSAPKEGAMAGLLIFEDPGAPVPGTHRISSDDAARLVGTIYTPRSKLVVDGNEPVSDESEYTIIVARYFELNEGPNLVMRTDYALSDVPVPNGVGPVSDEVPILVETGSTPPPT